MHVLIAHRRDLLAECAGLALKDDAMSELFRINKTEWQQEVNRIREFHATFGERMPAGMKQELGDLEKRIAGMPTGPQL